MESLTLHRPPARQALICIQDRIWFLNVSAKDRKLHDFQFPGWQAPQIFGNDRPIFIEYCSGNGAWIADKAEKNPHSNWVAVEYKFSRVRKIWGHIQRRNLHNLFIINGEALEATQNYFPTNSIAGVYINFPDPWPKRRHAKNRLMSLPFACELARILQPNAKVVFVTDNVAYSQWTIDILLSLATFESCYPSPYYSLEWPDYGSSFFDSLWREKGLQIHYHQFMRKS